jgi:predicted nucleic acid-binding protein
MIVVPDASTLLAALFPGPDNAAADRLLASEAEFHAPDQLKVDIAIALRQKFEQCEITAPQVAQVLGELDRIIAHWHPVHDLIAPSLAESIVYNHPLTDLFYLVLARRLKAQFVSANIPLLSALPYGSAAPLEMWQG